MIHWKFKAELSTKFDYIWCAAVARFSEFSGKNDNKKSLRPCDILTSTSDGLWILYSWDSPCSAIHVLVSPSRLDRVINRLSDIGYDDGPEPSKEFSISEGTKLDLSFHGNIRRDGEQQSIPAVFHFHGDVESHFRLSPVDKYLQRQLPAFRGVVDVHQLTHDDNSDGGRSDNTRTLVASHHVNIPKQVCTILHYTTWPSPLV